MSNKNEQNNIPEEIDLYNLRAVISKAINNLVMNTFLFFKKNAYKLVLLLFCGALLGGFADYLFRSYVAEVVVNSNFTTNDYLYSRVDQLNNHFIQNKNKELPISIYKKFSRIEVEPVIDVYSFVSNTTLNVANNAQNSQNFEMLKLMAEKGDINKIIEDEITSKNYYFQKINIISKEKVDEKDIKSIIKHLNKDTYFDSILHLNIENIKERIVKRDSTISQINKLIQSYSSSIASGNASVMFKNENSEVNSLINQKNELIQKIEQDKLSLISQNKIIKENTIVYNKINDKGIANKLKFLFPVLFIFLFFVIDYLKYLNKKSQKA
ncbi:hypothetical protein [Flavobacterium sp.]|jgi:hypothetical protein|uniref:hypothetical protein n=1 Tax=Flavobacterium sp. TaxID=239 RepID=UPI0037BEC7A7